MFGVSDDAPVAQEPSLDEINVKIPRHVRLSDDGRSSLKTALIALGIALAVLAALSTYVVHQWQQRLALDREGLEANAQVTFVSSGRGGSHVYYVFRAAGLEYRNSAPWNPGVGRLSEGSTITVLYLPSDPSVNHPEGWGWWDFGLLFMCVYIGALPAYLGVRAGWNLLRDWHLARHGLVTDGTVTLCVPQRSGNNFMVDYEFRTQTDFRTQQEEELIEGSDNDCHDEYKTDAKIRVIYLRNHPARNSSYPIPTFEMVAHKTPAGPFMTAQ